MRISSVFLKLCNISLGFSVLEKFDWLIVAARAKVRPARKTSRNQERFELYGSTQQKDVLNQIAHCCLTLLCRLNAQK